MKKLLTIARYFETRLAVDLESELRKSVEQEEPEPETVRTYEGGPPSEIPKEWEPPQEPAPALMPEEEPVTIHLTYDDKQMLLNAFNALFAKIQAASPDIPVEENTMAQQFLDHARGLIAKLELMEEAAPETERAPETEQAPDTTPEG